MSRREIREKVLQALYAQLLSGDKEDVVFARLLQADYQQLGRTAKQQKVEDPSEDDSLFLYNLYFGTLKEGGPYIDMIRPHLENWDYDRVAMVDRVLLHMALYEFLHCAQIPTRVTLNEYLELAKRYSTEKSNQFLNGVLDPILQELKTANQLHKTGKGLLETDIRKHAAKLARAETSAEAETEPKAASRPRTRTRKTNLNPN
jgi:N utilization substance protein B